MAMGGNILGIGTDIVSIERIEKSLKKWDEGFLSRLFTEGERAVCDKRKNRAACYAKRFAAKEACSKALGTGIAKGVRWTDMEVVLDENGAPQMALSGEAAERLLSMIGESSGPQVHLTLSDDYPWAVAFVVLSTV